MTAGEVLAGFAERRLELPSGGALRYFTAGEGPPLLLVHGLGGSALNWVAVAPKLAERLHVLVPDLPATAGPARAARVGSRAFADALAKLIRHERAWPLPVVGHSFGGPSVLGWSFAIPIWSPE